MYIVRADGNAGIGAGHLMRCLTIAEAIARLNGTRENILFVCADDASASFAGERGFQSRSLGTDYRHMEEEVPMWDVLWESLGGTAQSADGNVILVDSYYVTEGYLQKLRKYGRIILLDDMGQKAYPVDVIVNYNVFAEEEQYRQLYRGSNIGYCIGGQYVPVRPQFVNVEYQIADRVKNVLITTGGGDVDNIAGAILQKIFMPQTEYHVISGKFNPHREALEQFATAHGNVHVYHDVKDMAGMMRQCDLAVTAGGTTIYELAAIGVPFICFSYAENQEALTNCIGERKVAYSAGAYHKEAAKVLERMEALAVEICADKEKRMQCHKTEKALIDGKGAERLAQILCGLETE